MILAVANRGAQWPQLELALLPFEPARIDRFTPKGKTASPSLPSAEDLDRLRRLLPPLPTSGNGRPAEFWQAWLKAQLAQVPSLRVAVSSFAADVRRHPPLGVNEIFERARRVAAAHVGSPSSMSDEVRERHLTAAALSVIAAHTFRVPGLAASDRIIGLLPRYLDDGRLNDIGHDKVCHYWSHAFVTYMLRFDQEYGAQPGELASALARLERVDDVGAIVDAIEQAYHGSRGRSGPLMKSAKPVPNGPTPMYWEPAAYGDASEASAYRASVRGGYLYKHYRTVDAFGPYDASDIGQASPNDPWKHDTTRIQSGLWDAGVARDLLANDVGARAGVLLWRSPDRGPPVPFEKITVAREPDPGTAARAHAITKTLQRKEVSPARILELALRIAPQIFPHGALLGANKTTSIALSPAGWKISGTFAGGEASLTHDPRDHRPGDPVLFHLRIKVKGGPHAKLSFPATDLPSRAELLIERRSRGGRSL